MVSAHPPAVTVREMPPRHVVPFILGPATQRVGADQILPSSPIYGRNMANHSRNGLTTRTPPHDRPRPVRPRGCWPVQGLPPTSERAILPASTSESVTGTPASRSRWGGVNPPL